MACSLGAFIRPSSQRQKGVSIKRLVSIFPKRRRLTLDESGTFTTKKKRGLAKRTKRFVRRYGFLTANIIVVLAVAGIVLQNKHLSEAASSFGGVVVSSNTSEPVDSVAAADIATNVAFAAGLPMFDSVRNQADSVSALTTAAVSTASTVIKPQIIAAGDGSQSAQDIIEYIVQPGDSVTSVSQKFNIPSDSIRQSNDLYGDSLVVGRKLLLPPRNRSGIVYQVKSGDTAESIASNFNASAEKSISFNDAELNGLEVGKYIFIPDGKKSTPTYNYSSAVYVAAGIRPSYGSNGYTYGYCTWYVADKRASVGRPLPTNLGNAITWYSIAQAMGMEVGDTPRVGAVLWHTPARSATSLGHVAYVEAVNADGSVLVSEMNYVGYAIVSTRTVPAAEMGGYRFIY